MTRGLLVAFLVIFGAGWGLTQPLIKIAVSAGYQPFGLIFWQLLIGAALLGVLQWRRLGRVPLRRPVWVVWIMIALIGTVIPNSTSYRAAFFLPAGVMSIVIATIPMIAFPIALALRTDRFSWRRLCGLLLGLGGVALIALPQASLPERAMIAFLPLALFAPFCYAVEGNWVAKWGTAGMDAVQVLFGASVIGACVALPLALITDQFFVPRVPFQAADLAFIASSVIHVAVYAGYVWLVARAGAVFAGQVSYLVTGFGVLWSMLLLGERYSGWIWGALVLMVLGLSLVQPRQTIEHPRTSRETETA